MELLALCKGWDWTYQVLVKYARTQNALILTTHPLTKTRVPCAVCVVCRVSCVVCRVSCVL